MIKKLSLGFAAVAMGAASLVPATAAEAQGRHYGQRYERSYNNSYRDGYQRRVYRGQDRNYRAAQKCADGDGGTIVGALAGGLLGRTIDTRGDRLLGTVLGAAGGALAGRAIDRSDRPAYCRR